MLPTILVGDDDPTIRDILASALADAGYGVEQASDGLMALKQIARQVLDLILADVRMPDAGCSCERQATAHFAHPR